LILFNAFDPAVPQVEPDTEPSNTGPTNTGPTNTEPSG